MVIKGRLEIPHLGAVISVIIIIMIIYWSTASQGAHW